METAASTVMGGEAMADRGRGERDWEGLVARWRASGKSMLAYSRERGISYWQLVRWRRRIEAQPAAKPLTLIPLAPQASSGGGVVVRLPDGVGIEVDRGFDAGVLTAVVQALQGPRPC
jgi:hypothetical protein